MKSKIITGLSILVGAIMVSFGLNKFLNFIPMPEPDAEQMKIFKAFLTLKWIFPLVAVAEVVGGVLIAIPRTRTFGALVLFPVIIGIVVHHATHDIAGIGMGLFLLIISLWVIYEDRKKLLPIIQNQ